MAIGIDDVLTLAKSALGPLGTIVETINAIKRKNPDKDIEQLIREAETSLVRRLAEAELALAQFERTLVEKGVNLDKPLGQVIAETAWWEPFEAYRMKNIRGEFHSLEDTAYNSVDDVAALLRCKGKTALMGEAVVQTAEAKHKFHKSMLEAPSVKAAIEILRKQFAEQRAALLR
jgi:hypothetical protein